MDIKKLQSLITQYNEITDKLRTIYHYAKRISSNETESVITIRSSAIPDSKSDEYSEEVVIPSFSNAYSPYSGMGLLRDAFNKHKRKLENLDVMTFNINEVMTLEVLGIIQVSLESQRMHITKQLADAGVNVEV